MGWEWGVVGGREVQEEGDIYIDRYISMYRYIDIYLCIDIEIYIADSFSAETNTIL